MLKVEHALACDTHPSTCSLVRVALVAVKRKRSALRFRVASNLGSHLQGKMGRVRMVVGRFSQQSSIRDSPSGETWDEFRRSSPKNHWSYNG
eukprot:2154166-Pyramimonas_sp.AAC.1